MKLESLTMTDMHVYIAKKFSEYNYENQLTHLTITSIYVLPSNFDEVELPFWYPHDVQLAIFP